MSALFVASALFVSRPVGLCVRAGIYCIEARRSLCQAPELSVPGLSRDSVSRPGPGVLSVGPNGLCVALCVGVRRSLSRAPRCSALARRSPCRHPALSMSPGTLCVEPRRSSRPADLCASGHPVPQIRVFMRMPLSRCVGPQLKSSCHASSSARATHPVPRAAQIRVPIHAIQSPSSDPRGTHPPIRSASPAPIRVPPISSAGPQVRGPPAQICVPPIQPGAFFFPGENRKPDCLGE